MKLAFLFAGQGAQAVGMGKDFYDTYPEAKKIYDEFPSIRDLCFNEDPEGKLNQTAYAQKAMLLTGYVIASLLKEKGIEPSYVCGLSLGEYTALTFAEAWTLKDAIEIVTERGRIMQNALPLGTTKMAAILGLDRETILTALKEVKGVVEIANYNCPGQIVITGENAAVDKACELLLQRGARRALPLNVSGAFHSSLLIPASHELRTELDKHQHQKPIYSLVYNCSAKEETRELNDILQDQICHSVYFEDTLRYLIAQGVDTFVEIGPGRTLTGFVRKTDNSVPCYNVSDLASFDAALEKLCQH